MIEKYSYYYMISEFQKNRVLIHAYVNKLPIEGMSDTGIMGMSIGLFIAVFVIYTVLFWWALIMAISDWKLFSDGQKWWIVLSWLFLGGPLVPLVSMYIFRGQKKGKLSSFFRF